MRICIIMVLVSTLLGLLLRNVSLSAESIWWWIITVPIVVLLSVLLNAGDDEKIECK